MSTRHFSFTRAESASGGRDDRAMTEAERSTGWHVRVAETPFERGRVFRFRFDNYVSEYGRWPDQAQGSRRALHDDLDDEATLFFVELDERVVATLRLRIGGSPPSMQAAPAGQTFVSLEGGGLGLADRIFVPRIFRRAGLLESVMEAVSAGCRERGVHVLYCDVRREEVSLLEPLGFREYAPPFDHPELGQRVPLVRALTAKPAATPSARKLPEAPAAGDGRDLGPSA